MMEYVWSTIDFLVMYLFALCFFKPRRRIGKRIDFIILIVVAVMASFINDYFANSDINLVVTIIFIVVVLGFFEGNWKRKLFVGSSFFAFIIYIKNSIFRNSLIFQGLPPIKYQNLMYFPLFLPL